MNPKIGQRIMTAMDDAPNSIGTIVAGPVWKGGKAVFKVQIADGMNGVHEIWLSPDLMRPLLRGV